MKTNRKLQIICIAIPLSVGGLAAWLTRDEIRMFESIRQPPLSPPGWLFPIVWTFLYVLMGYACYAVLTSGCATRSIRNAVFVYGVQLAFNFLWPLVFFGASRYLAALIVIILLWFSILATTMYFYRIRQTAGNRMLPYLLWVTFAAYLNYGVYRLN